MKMSKWMLAAAMLCATLQAGIALGDEATPVVKATNKDDFAAVATAIRQQMGQGGRWQYVSKSEKADVDNRLVEMQGLFDEFGTVDKMDQVTKARLFNDQEVVNDILTRRDGNRLVCSNEIPTGSHIPQRVCRTYAQMRQDQQNAQDMMDHMQHRGSVYAGGG